MLFVLNQRFALGKYIYLEQFLRGSIWPKDLLFDLLVSFLEGGGG